MVRREARLALAGLALVGACAGPGREDEGLDDASSETTTETGESGETGDGDGDGDPGEPTLVLAVIGDYGDAGPAEAAVAALVDSWAPDHVLTTGDNNYEDGEAATIDANIGQYYAKYIGNYVGAYGPGADENRFWPVPGNHDWHTPGLGPYLDYFTLPGNERYYALALRDDVAIFAIDSDADEPHGTSADSPQATMFFQVALTTSPACWNIALLHHAPYSSGEHGSDESMRWPFAEWGADLVFAGHDHHYERLEVDGVPYFVNGLGGRNIYSVNAPIPESLFLYNDNYGAQRVTITGGRATISFFDVTGQEIDSVTVEKDCSG